MMQQSNEKRFRFVNPNGNKLIASEMLTPACRDLILNTVKYARTLNRVACRFLTALDIDNKIDGSAFSVIYTTLDNFMQGRINLMFTQHI